MAEVSKNSVTQAIVSDDEQGQRQGDEVPEGEERVHRQVAVELQRRETQTDAGRWHASQTVLAAGEVRQRVELEVEEHLGDGHRDHREIDAGPAQSDQADQIVEA